MLKSESILGKQQNIIGSSDKDIILQTKGKVKIQQGNKFIDLILNGKLNFPDIINKVNTKNDIGKTLGFYYVVDENIIYALIDGKLIPLGDGTYSNSEEGVNKLSELEDVLLVNVRNGDLLVYQGGFWVNSLYNIKDLEDLVNKVDGIESDLKTESNFTQRTFQDVMETFEMMFDPEGDYFTDKIKPLAIHTAQLIVGTNSQQFSLENIRFEPNFLGDCNRFGANVIDITKPGLLIHNTIGLENNAGYTWEVLKDTVDSSLTIPDWDIKNLDPNKPYYLYARCSKRNNQGEFILSTEQILLEQERDFYYFWVGVLNTPKASLDSTNETINSDTVEASKIRSFQTMYGFTEIAGNTITTGVIKDQTGSCYWDMIHGNFKMGSPDNSTYIRYDSNTQTLHLKGYLTQEDPDIIGTPNWRGSFIYGSSILYKKGDVVEYQGSTYIAKQDVYGNIYPTNTTYWELFTSKGDQGEQGEQGDRGPTGSDGPQGPTITFEGTYERGKKYYGTSYRASVVKHGSTFYIAKYEDLQRTFTDNNSSPSSTYWRQMSSFDSVATDLLFANRASIAGWQFNNNVIWNKNDAGDCFINGTANTASDWFLGVGTPGYISDNGDSSNGYLNYTINDSKQKFAIYGNGSIYSTAGIIGGFNIQSDGLYNTNFDSKIKISNSNSSKYVSIGGSGDTCISISSYGSGNIGLYVLANSSSAYAIESYGSHRFSQRSGESWQAPGVLTVYHVSSRSGAGSCSISRIWGEGCTLSSVNSKGNGSYDIFHNIGHSNYSFLGVLSGSSYIGSMRVTARSSTSGGIDWHNFNGDPITPSFYLYVIGQYTWK